MVFAPLQTARFLLQHPLTRARPLSSLARYARWQLASRLASGPIAVGFVNDARLLVRPGMTGATGNVYAGLHEFEDMAFVLHALRPQDLFVDVGANVGSYTVLAAKAVGAHVVAFEPIAATFKHLRDNIALNSIEGRVDARQVCVGAASGMIAMTSEQDCVNHVVVDQEAEQSSSVAVTTLDAALQGRIPFMLKLDVEGYELEVLRGASNTLADPGVQCLIVEFGDAGERYGHTTSDLIGLLRSFGFNRYAYSPIERRLRADEVPRGCNTIFVRDPELVQSRLDKAPSFRVLDRVI